MLSAIQSFFGKYALILGAVLVAALLAAIGVQTVRLNHAQTQYAQLEASHLRERVTQERDAREDAQAVTAKEKEILAKASATKEKDDEKIRTLSADAARLDRLLRNRPMRPKPADGVAGAASATGSCSGGGSGATGAELYLEDGEFLAREASRAERYRIQRDSAIKQYNDARDALAKQNPRGKK